MGGPKKPYDQWLMIADDWWGMNKGDSAYDYPDLPWQEWYAEGISPQEAAGRADAQVYGYAFDADVWPIPPEAGEPQ